MAAALDEVEAQLSKSRFLCGDKVTEADVRLFPTVVRFDAVYATLFKCSNRRVADLPNLSVGGESVSQGVREGGCELVFVRRIIQRVETELNVHPLGPPAADAPP